MREFAKANSLTNSSYSPTNLMTVAMMNITAKSANETPKPTPESIASLRFDCTFFSNWFTTTPPISTLV